MHASTDYMYVYVNRLHAYVCQQNHQLSYQYQWVNFLQEQARAHFNCSTLEGVEIENQGGGGTSFAHWEQRVLGVNMFNYKIIA